MTEVDYESVALKCGVALRRIGRKGMVAVLYNGEKFSVVRSDSTRWHKVTDGFNPYLVGIYDKNANKKHIRDDAEWAFNKWFE